MRAGQRATTAEGRTGSLGRLLVGPGGRREAAVTLDAMARDGAPGPAVAVRAVRPKDREPVIVATNRPDARALAAYRKRWAIECFFADARTRGLNLEDTPPHLPEEGRPPRRHPRHRHRLGRRHRRQAARASPPAQEDAWLSGEVRLPHRPRAPPKANQKWIPTQALDPWDALGKTPNAGRVV